MTFAEDFKPDTWVNIGDLGHFAGISHWNTKKYHLRLKYPIKADLDGMFGHHRDCRKIVGEGRIITLGGNHDDIEEGWPKYWLDDHPEMQGYFDYHKDIGITDFGVEYVSVRKQPFKLGKMRFIHGHYTNKYHTDRHARAYSHNLIYGHVHDFQSITPEDKDPTRRYMVWSMGHLMDEAQADFLRSRPTNWCLGFGAFYLDEESGYFQLIPIPIPAYRLVWDGKVYKN